MIGFVLLGFVVGGLAGLVVPGRSRLGVGVTFVLALLGSVLGGVAANALGSGELYRLNLIGSAGAIGGAVVLIVIGERLGWLTDGRTKER